MPCLLCERIQKTNEGLYPFIIHEFKNSYLYLGEHQYYEGYCILVTKTHFREMTDLPQKMRDEVFQEMMICHEAIQKVFQPKKMNLCSLGNVVDHVHWHFFPRYADDQNFKNPPWLQMNLFDSAKTSPEKRVELIEKLKQVISAM